MGRLSVDMGLNDPGHRKKVWYLQHVDLFASMTHEEIERVARLLNDYHFPAGTELLGDGHHDRLYLVKEGAVRLHVGEQRRPVTMALIGPGRIFGLSSTVGDNDRLISATTLVPSYVCIATWPKMMGVFVQFPTVMLKMTHALADQLFRAETWRERFGMSSSQHRLTSLLVELSDEFGEPDISGQGSRIRFRLTQADLASMIGLSRETVSRLMTDFCHRGWVTREGDLLVVRDRDALAVHGTGIQTSQPKT